MGGSPGSHEVEPWRWGWRWGVGLGGRTEAPGWEPQGNSWAATWLRPLWTIQSTPFSPLTNVAETTWSRRVRPQNCVKSWSIVPAAECWLGCCTKQRTETPLLSLPSVPPHSSAQIPLTYDSDLSFCATALGVPSLTSWTGLLLPLLALKEPSVSTFHLSCHMSFHLKLPFQHWLLSSSQNLSPCKKLCLSCMS